jgi:aspartyl-tRNA(Asn)/glutamyl-tRNA(Gln) amidotransferase subunit B
VPRCRAAARDAAALRGDYAARADAATLTASRGLAAYFEEVLRALGGGAANAKLAANWIQGDVAAALNRAEIGIEQAPVPAAALARLLSRIVDQTISGKIAKDVFDACGRASTAAIPMPSSPPRD